MKSWFNSLPSLGPNARRLLVVIAGAALLCTYALEVTSSSHALSATWDEPYHILAGYSYWHAGDYGINPEHPPLAKLVGAVPLLFMNLRVPRIGRDDSKYTANVFGRALVYRNEADTVLLRVRLAEAVVGLVLVLLLFEAGYRMFGAGAASIAVLLAVFEPNLLAHTSLVNTDFALTCFYFAAVYALWRAAERPTLLRLAGCGVMSGLALASKHSGILLIPTLAVLAAVEVAYGVKRATPGTSVFGVLRREAPLWIGRLVVVFGLAYVILWGFYGFRYHARPDGLPLWQPLATYTHAIKGALQALAVSIPPHATSCCRNRTCSASLMCCGSPGAPALFSLGRLYPHAVWYYFPVAFVIKSTLGFLILLILALGLMKSWSGECLPQGCLLADSARVFMGLP